MRLPSVVSEAGLPARVSICDVGPRDGLQNESAVVATATKVEFIRRLVRSGLAVVEATSLVRPDWIPSSPTPRRCVTRSFP